MPQRHIRVPVVVDRRRARCRPVDATGQQCPAPGRGHTAHPAAAPFPSHRTSGATVSLTLEQERLHTLLVRADRAGDMNQVDALIAAAGLDDLKVVTRPVEDAVLAEYARSLGAVLSGQRPSTVPPPGGGPTDRPRP
uniref:hypothetical protein n=1 Tax=Amycolatopsis sp. CA-096443 TaxID=3239919 RepID=UPI003F4960DC